MSKIVPAPLAAILLLLASTTAIAQGELTLFDKIEHSLKEKLPEWMLLNRAPNPHPEHKVIMYQWGLEGKEVHVWMSELASAEEAARELSQMFEDTRTEDLFMSNDIGDKCYTSEGRGGYGSGLLVFIKANVIVRINAERIDEGAGNLLRMFALHIAEQIPAG
jgi:hypothetical protein